MKKYILTISASAVIFLLASVYLMMTGPRMRYQYKIKTYSSRFSPPPRGTVPVEVYSKMPQDEIKNPVAELPEDTGLGKVYYGYYCIFCHGETGKGDGEAGQSYFPRPANLNSDNIRSLSDAALYRAMLTGTGHDPVLERVVPGQYRWYIVLYVRTFQEKD